MFVVMVAAECAPVAQAGGLGEVVCGLSRELELRGNAVEIVLPKYDCLRYDRVDELTVAYEDLWVPWYSGAIHCTVLVGFVDGRKCFLIEPHSADGFFERGHLYGSPDDVTRFAFFSKAAVEFMLKAGKRPQIVHCHDWHTALVPVLLFEVYQQIGMSDQRVCFTVHNFSHQGVAGEWVLWATGLCDPGRYFVCERLRDDCNPFALNLLKGGILYSNFVTTVSPRHAWEVCYSDQGHGLGHTLHVHRDKFGGVLNGVDYETWNPETDSWIPQRYGPDSIDDKYVNKHALRERFMLRDDYKPIVCYVGRLDHQKGRASRPPRDLLRARTGRAVRALGVKPRPGDQQPLLASQAAPQRPPRRPPRAALRSRARAPRVRGVRPAGDAQHVRALRPSATDRAALRHRPDRPRLRRARRHRRRPRPRCRSSPAAYRLRL